MSSVQELRILGREWGLGWLLYTVAPGGAQAFQASWNSGGLGAHLSFTSSFTPELAWRAWFIMSCTNDRAVSWLEQSSKGTPETAILTVGKPRATSYPQL